MLNPIIVEAPLKRFELEKTDIDNVYIFDYNKSFVNDDYKPKKLISYLQSLGCMCDILVDNNVSYYDKEQLIIEYFNSGVFFNLYTLTTTIIKIVLYYKGIDYNGRCILTNNEVDKFLERNKKFIEQIVQIYDSIFLIMLLYSINPTNDIKVYKKRYPSNYIDRTDYSPNICNVLLCKDFYRYYEKHLNTTPKYYEFLFEENIYKSKCFLDILVNPENDMIKIMMDMNNPMFQKYIEKKES